MKTVLNKMKTTAISILMLTSWMTCSTEAAKILLLPLNMNSHVLVFARLGEELGHLGHKTVLVTPSNAKIPHEMAHKNFTIIVYPVPEKTAYCSSREFSEILVEFVLSKSQLWMLLKLPSYMKTVVEKLQSDYHNLWRNKDIMRQLENFKFEFAITDLNAAEFSYLIPLHLAIPYATASISSVALAYRVPRLSSFVSVSYSDEMTFKERLITFLLEITAIMTYDSSVHYINKYIPHLQVADGHELLINSSFWLFTEDPVLGFPSPHMPNTLSFGDIIARPGRPLPSHLQVYLDEATQGAILVSLGSYFDYIPKFLTRDFCTAFRNTSYRIIWKLAKDEFCNEAKNVKVLPWLPQNDILAHKNVRIFISHGGFNSFAEATYHGKPLIMFPMIADQPGNAALAVARGFAIKMDISDFTSEELRGNIEEMMNNPNFTRNARQISSIFREKKETAAERVSFMIEHVLKYGDAHLRTAAFKLSLLQFLMFDIFLCLLAVLLFIGILTFAFIWCFSKTLSKCLAKAKKEKLA